MAQSNPISVPVAVTVDTSGVVKDGVRTTEFWTTIFMHLITLSSMIVVLTGHQFSGTALTPLVPAAAALASGICQAYYSHSRSTLKQQAASMPPLLIANALQGATQPNVPPGP